MSSSEIEIAIIGGTQGIGRQCLLLLLVRGVKVRVLARTPSILSPLDEQYANQLTIIKGDATNEQDVEKLITPNTHSVLCALGVKMNEPTTVVQTGAINSIKAMKKLDRDIRFVMVTSAALLKSNHNWFFDNVVKKHLLNYIYDDLARAEQSVIELTKDSKINYTIVRPPQLIDSALTLEIDISENEKYSQGTNLVTREDVAAVMLRCVFDEKYTVGNRQFNMNTTKVLEAKVDFMKVLKGIMPYPKYLMIRLCMFSVMVGVGSLGGFALFKLKSLLFPQLTFESIHKQFSCSKQ